MLKIDLNDMERPLANIEFFAYESEVWYRAGDAIARLTESNTELIDGMIEMLSTFYPKAYDALCEAYRGCALNKRYYRYRIVTRFIRCNFSQLDNIPDISASNYCTFEYVSCPLRGECKLDQVVCHPEFDHKLSQAEMPVMRMWYEGADENSIADKLCLSPHTIHNHIRNAYQRTNTHSRSEFVKYAASNNLFS